MQTESGGPVLVADRDGNEEAWLAARRTLVTASESAHLMGCYRGAPFELPADHLARRKLEPDPVADAVGVAAHAGRFWEDSILGWFLELTGLWVNPRTTLFRSREHPFMGATPDGEVVYAVPDPPWDLFAAPYLRVVTDFDTVEGREAAEVLRTMVGLRLEAGHRVLLEVKNQESKRRSRWNKPGKTDAGYRNQCLHQAVVMEADLVLLAARVDANELYVHPIVRDAEYEERLVSTCRRFHERYLTGDGI